MKVSDNITITNEDNMELMKRYPDNYFTIGIIDVPYGLDVGNMSFLKEKKTNVKQKNGNKLNANKNKNYQLKDWDKKPPSNNFWLEFKRITQNQIVFGVDYVKWKDLGKGRIKWNKGVPEKLSFKGFENAYCSFIDYTKEIDYLWSGMMQGKSISEPMTQQGNKKLNEKRLHPTQKPVFLYDLIFLFCLECGIDISKVIDTNIGLGSICVSSTKFKEVKEFVGCDIDADYYELTIKRIKEHKQQLKMF